MDPTTIILLLAVALSGVTAYLSYLKILSGQSISIQQHLKQLKENQTTVLKEVDSLAKLMTKSKTLASEYADSEAKSKQMSADLKNLQATCRNLLSDVNKMERERESLQHELQAHKKQQAEFVQQKQELDKDYISYWKQREELDNLSSKLDAVAKDNEARLIELQDKTSQTAQLRIDLESLEKEKHDLLERKRELNDLENINSAVEERLAIARAKVDRGLVGAPAKSPNPGKRMCPVCWGTLAVEEQCFLPRWDQGALGVLFEKYLPTPEKPQPDLEMPPNADGKLTHAMTLADTDVYLARPEVGNWGQRFLPGWNRASVEGRRNLVFHARCPNRPCLTGFYDNACTLEVPARSKIPLPIHRSIRVSVVGASDAGKTSFIAVLQHLLLAGGLQPYGLEVQPDSPESYKACQELEDQVYGTREIKASPKGAFSDYSFTLRHNGEHYANLFLRDLSGEDWGTINSGMSTSRYGRHSPIASVLYSDVMLFLLDPLGTSLRSAVHKEENTDNGFHNQARHQSRILQGLYQLSRDLYQEPPRLSVLITKADELIDRAPRTLYGDFSPKEFKRRYEGDLGHNWDHSVRKMPEFRRFVASSSVWLDNRLQETCPELDLLLKCAANFNTTSFFATSAIGQRPQKHGDSHKLSEAPRPVNVLSPLIYHLDQMHLLPVGAAPFTESQRS